MKTGRFKVFSTCNPWLEEFRSYYRKDGKLKTVMDDALKSSFYALMMLPYAASEAELSRFSRNHVPAMSLSMEMR